MALDLPKLPSKKVDVKTDAPTLVLPKTSNKKVESKNVALTLNLPKRDDAKKDLPEVIPDYMFVKKTIPSLFMGETRIFGEPGASLTWGIDGMRNTGVITAGKEGEIATGKLLAELANEIDGLYVFHSLRWPESNGDTDHIIVFKDLAIVIDTKRWKGSRKYSITAKGEIKRGTVPFPEGKVKIGYALASWRKKLVNSKLLGIVSIAQEKVFVVRDRNWYTAPYRLVEGEKLKEHIVSTIKKHKSTHTNDENMKTLYALAGFVVKPRDPRAGLIQGSTESPYK